MVILNDYLYSGDTVLRILQKYMQDLRKEAKETHNEIDLAHCNFLIQIMELLEHKTGGKSKDQIRCPITAEDPVLSHLMVVS